MRHILNAPDPEQFGDTDDQLDEIGADLPKAEPADVVVLIEGGEVTHVATRNPDAIVSVIDADLLKSEGMSDEALNETVATALLGLSQRYPN